MNGRERRWKKLFHYVFVAVVANNVFVPYLQRSSVAFWERKWWKRWPPFFHDGENMIVGFCVVDVAVVESFVVVP